MTPSQSMIVAGLVDLARTAARTVPSDPGGTSSHPQDRDMFMESTSHTLVGIDVAKHSLDVYLASEDRCFTIENSTAGFKQLSTELPAAGSCLVVVEATGGYQSRVVGALVTAGHRVAVVNPRQVRDFARGLGILAKTDRLDARVIARFGEQANPRPVEIGSEKQAELRELVTRRRQLIELRTAEQNRLETTAHEGRSQERSPPRRTAGQTNSSAGGSHRPARRERAGAGLEGRASGNACPA